MRDIKRRQLQICKISFQYIGLIRVMGRIDNVILYLVDVAVAIEWGTNKVINK